MAVLGATNLTGCNSIPDFIAGGSLVTFQQTSAPTSWTKQTTHDNKALRVVSGTATPGGSTAFTTVFASRTPAGSVSVSVSGGSVGDTTLTTPQIPSHTHNYTRKDINPVPNNGFLAAGSTRSSINSTVATVSSGGNGAHSHPFTVGTASGTFSGSALDFAVAYVDVIICSKN
jgi:hypothetical protein